MSRLDELPPDQRSALALLLLRHKSYSEVAAMLGIAEQAVHDRAHAALAVLAPSQARGIDAEHRREIGDYLLGQQTAVGQRLRTRTLLSSSQAAGAWAGAIAGELAELYDGAPPEIPGVDSGDDAASAPVARQEPYPLAQAASTPASVETGTRAPSSRLGGALLLAAMLAAVIVTVILLVSGGGSSNKKASTTGTGSKSAKTSGAKEEGRFTLHAATPHSRSVGTVEVLSEGGKRAFYIQAEHIPATKHFFYAIWLYNSHTSALPLSKSPAVGKTHKLAGAALLPSNASSYREILLTRETSTRPKHPGHVVLRGAFNLAG
jgi:hypothetical protein